MTTHFYMVLFFVCLIFTLMKVKNMSDDAIPVLITPQSLKNIIAGIQSKKQKNKNKTKTTCKHYLTTIIYSLYRKMITYGHFSQKCINFIEKRPL